MKVTKTQKNNIVKIVKAMNAYIHSDRSDFEYYHGSLELCTVGFSIHEKLFPSLNIPNLNSIEKSNIITRLFGEDYYNGIVFDGLDVYNYEVGREQMIYIHNRIISTFNLDIPLIDDSSDKTREKINARIAELNSIMEHAENFLNDRLLGVHYNKIRVLAENEIASLQVALQL